MNLVYFRQRHFGDGATPLTAAAFGRGFVRGCALIPALLCMVLSGCKLRHTEIHPSIEFSRIPSAANGDPNIVSPIAGRVDGTAPGQQVVLYAKAGVWWVQPLADRPFTAIQSDSTWKSYTHPGREYAALLVRAGYQPPPTMNVLPSPGGLIAAVATVPGAASTSPPEAAKMLQFSGYQWSIRSIMSNRNGVPNQYDPGNAWTDAKGFLHLRIARRGGRMTCAEAALVPSVGYGTYHVTVQDTGHFDPAVIFSFFTWEDAPLDPNHREMDVELSRWGDPKRQNAEFMIQPYYIAANVSRFTAPPGLLTHSMHWEPEKVTFVTTRGDISDVRSRPIAFHVFSAGIPSPGSQSVRMNFCGVGDATASLQHEAEIVIERFQYLP